MTGGPRCGLCGQWARVVVGDGTEHVRHACLEHLPRLADPGDVCMVYVQPAPDLFIYGGRVTVAEG